MGILDSILGEKFTSIVPFNYGHNSEKRLQALNKLQEEYPNNTLISKEIEKIKKGDRGEDELLYELQISNIGMYVLHDVNVEYNGLTAQIDYILVTPAKNYFIECKNWDGNIIVNERGEVIIEKYKYRRSVESPIRQAERHKEIFKKIWLTHHNSFIDKVFARDQKFENWNRTLVVLTNHNSLLKINPRAPKEIKYNILKSENLVDQIKFDINRTDKDLLSSKKEMQADAEAIYKNYNTFVDKDYYQEYKAKLIKEDNTSKTEEKIVADTSDLKEKLIKFRKNRAIEKRVPAYYIFTNEELDNILANNPKDIEELKRCLPAIKVKVHGEEILKLLQNNG